MRVGCLLGIRVEGLFLFIDSKYDDVCVSYYKVEIENKSVSRSL